MADNVVPLQQRPTPKREIEVSLRPATPCEIDVFIAALDGPRHPEAKARFAAHRARLPETRVHLTPSSGLHFIFRHAWGVRNTQSRLAVGIDTRGEGGFVPKIVPGDIAVTRRANPDGILPTVINNKAAEICSPQLQPNGRDRAPTPDNPAVGAAGFFVTASHSLTKGDISMPARGGALITHRLVAKSAAFKDFRNADATMHGNGYQSSMQSPSTYLQLGWPLFPVNPRTRAPLIKGGFYGATTDEATIADWLQRWPRGLLATPTGRSYRHIAVDVDIKHPPISGFDALAGLGWAVLPNTPMVHSPSGGLHLHLDPGELEIPSTQGTIGAGIDVRGEISSIILPTLGSKYEWDPIWSVFTVGLAPAPDWLIPRASERKASAEVPAKLQDAYAAAALADACRRIRNAPAGQQEATLNSECFAIGTLAGANGIPADIALSWLLTAAHDMPDYDHRRRWRAREIVRKVEHAFADGLRRPREVRHV